eukprot:g27877.t1
MRASDSSLGSSLDPTEIRELDDDPDEASQAVGPKAEPIKDLPSVPEPQELQGGASHEGEVAQEPTRVAAPSRSKEEAEANLDTPQNAGGCCAQ